MNKANLSINDFLKKPYARILLPEEEGGYAAEILEFPGCFASGETADDAIKNLENAAISWIEAAIEQNQEIPEPLATYGYSGKINLRLPRSIHKQAARFAQKDDVSLNQFFISAIAARVGAEEFYDRLVQKIECQLMPSFNFAAHLTLISMGQTPTIPFGSSIGGVQYFNPSETSKVISNA